MTEAQSGAPRMDQDGAGGSRGAGNSRWVSKGALVLYAAFGAPLLLIAVAGSLFLTVPLVYAIICVEGDAIIYLAIWRSQTIDGQMIVGGETRGPAANRAFVSVGSVETMSSYARSAGRGSDFSRREIARTLARILAYSSTASENRGEGTPSNEDLSDAFATVIHPYEDDPVVKTEMRAVVEGRRHARGTGAGGDAPKVGRAEYLADLEKIVSKLERDMDRSGGP